MIEIAKFFKVLFLSAKISRACLKDFTEDHIQRLTTNNPGGIFTEELDAVTIAYNSFFGDLSNESLNLAVQEGKTKAMQDSRGELVKNISENKGLIEFTYRKDKPVIQEFYPNGMEEYYRADLSNLETICMRYKKALENHSTDFSPEFITDYGDVLNTFTKNRAAQQTAFGKVAAERSGIANSRPDLCFQLTFNLLTISKKYLGDESKADVYFNQTILNTAFAHAASKVESDINPNATENVFDNTASPETKYKITITGEGALMVGYAVNDVTPITLETGKTVVGGDVKIFAASELGFTSDKKFLNITNGSEISLVYIIERV